MGNLNSPGGADEYARRLLDAVPLAILVVDEDLRILDFNAAAALMVNGEMRAIIRRRGGEALQCIHSTDVPGGCGQGPFCQDCIIRNSVTTAIRKRELTRRQGLVEVVVGAATREIQMLVTAAPFVLEGQTRALLTLEDVSELVPLRGFLTMCSRCKDIRDDQQHWHSLEDYLARHANIQFSHGLCPECAHALFPEFALSEKSNASS